jgi:hypothetical protein
VIGVASNERHHTLRNISRGGASRHDAAGLMKPATFKRVCLTCHGADN